MPAKRALIKLALAASLLLVASACASEGPTTLGQGTATVLRLGYLANVTQASAVYGVATGGFQKSLGGTRLKALAFGAGPAAIEAMRGGSLDAAFLGPNPAVNGFVQTEGRLLRIVAGTTSGGAALIVKPSITSVEQLDGKRIATPQLGNTQDVAAKSYFKQRRIEVDVVNQDNAQTLDLFKQGKIDGGWVPEPWASRLVLNGGGKVLVDERSLWPRGEFVTAHLVVRQTFLKKYPGTVKALLEGLVAATTAVATKSAAVQAVVNGQLLKQTGKRLKPAILRSAFANLTPTVDPIAGSLAQSAKNAQAVGLLKAADLKGIYDLTILNELLAAAGRPEISDASLGVS